MHILKIFMLDDAKIEEVHFGCSEESYCTSPVYFSVKVRNTNPVSYFPFLCDILQFMYKIQTPWFLCRNASSKCGDNCVLNHFAWHQPIKMRVGSAFALLSDPNMSLLHSSVVLQSTLFAGREGLLFLEPDCFSWVEKKCLRRISPEHEGLYLPVFSVGKLVSQDK